MPPDPILDLEDAAAIVGDCVGCGLCLPACPTYELWGEEADSPRGRILQIGDALAAGATVSAEMAGHLDACVGCLACVSACPAGVAYDRLLAEARPLVERSHPRTPAERALRLALLETLPYPGRLRRLLPALRAARRLSGRRRVPERVRLLAQLVPDPPAEVTPPPAFTAARGPRRGQVGLLLGCVQRVFFADVHRATIAVLSAEGFDVHAPALPDCCGALELGAGEREHGIARAQATIAAFAGLGELDAVIVDAAGCGVALKGYGTLLNDAAAWEFAGRVRDICEFLTEVEPVAARGAVPGRVAYHAACQLHHGQGVGDAVRAVLRAIPGLELVEADAASAHCCGAAGAYPVLQPEPAAALGRRAAGELAALGVATIATTHPGCVAQLGRHLRERGTAAQLVHPVELLARSLRAGAAPSDATLAGPASLRPEI